MVRKAPNFLWQLLFFSRRSVVSVLSNLNQRILSFGIHVLAGFIVGLGIATDAIFVPAIPQYYVPYCPTALQQICLSPSKSSILILTF